MFDFFVDLCVAKRVTTKKLFVDCFQSWVAARTICWDGDLHRSLTNQENYYSLKDNVIQSQIFNAGHCTLLLRCVTISCIQRTSKWSFMTIVWWSSWFAIRRVASTTPWVYSSWADDDTLGSNAIWISQSNRFATALTGSSSCEGL